MFIISIVLNHYTIYNKVLNSKRIYIEGLSKGFGDYQLTKEEYLVRHEDKLIEKLTSNYLSINKNLLFCFSLTLAFFLLKFNLIEEASLIGNKIKLSEQYLLILMPFIIILPYLLIINSISSISKIISLLKSNANSIRTINMNSRPFEIKDLEFLTQGIAGLQFHFSIWIIRNYLSNKKIDFGVEIPENMSIFQKCLFYIFLPINIYEVTNKFVVKVIKLIIPIFSLALIYTLPLLVCVALLYNSRVEAIIDNSTSWVDFLNINILVVTALLMTIILTLIFKLKMYSLYFNELSTVEINFNSDILKKFNVRAIKIFDFFQ